MKSKWLLCFALAVVPSAFAARTAVPGTVNYIEGQVTVNGRAVKSAQNGNITLAPHQVLSVGTGKAEILLSPGTFLRVGNGAQVQMLASDLSNPQVQIIHGEALIEVDYKPKIARLDVMERGADTQLLKAGLYRFNAEQAVVQVVNGKASVEENGHSKDIGRGKELVLTNSTLKAASFNNSSKSEDELYRWSSVRDGYLAQANAASARQIYVDGGYGPGWGMGWGLGWYWNPYYDTYAWMPGDGYFWSPFGYPFFSPGYIVYAPRIGGFRGGFPGGVRVGRGGAPGFVGGRVGGMAAAPRFSGGARMGGRR